MFNPDDFWQLAVSLLGQESVPESHCRTAASRAYYAFFLTVRDQMPSFQPQHNAADHGRVMAELRRRNRGALAEALRRLRTMRETADYNLGVSVTQFQVDRIMTLTAVQYQNAKRLR
ncbi:MAG: hypothetical protein HYU30_00445 [Chloroflexi bacterium]|nr:hypothetical protein [Chloroflexota bacterium]